MQQNKTPNSLFPNWRNGRESENKALREAQKRLEQYRATVRLASAEIEYRNRVIRALTAFTYQASRLTSATDLLDLALGQALKTASAHMGSIILIDPATNNLTMGTYRGLTPDLVRILTGRQLDEGATVLMPHLVSGKGALVEVGDAIAPDERNLLKSANVSSLVSLPLQAGYQLLGAMVIGTKDTFTSADVHCLIAIAQETAVALEALDLREKLWNTAESLLTWETDTEDLGPTGFTNPMSLPPLTVKFAECVTQLGGSMGAIFILDDTEDRGVYMAADYGLSPLVTSKYARFHESDAFFPFDKLTARNLLVKDIGQSQIAQKIPLLHSLEEEGARSALAILLDNGDHPDAAIIIATPSSDQLTPEDIDQVIPKIRRLMPYLTDENLPATPLPIGHTTNDASPHFEDMERLLTAMISAEEAVDQHNADFAVLNTIGEMVTRLTDLDVSLSEIVTAVNETMTAKATWLYLKEGAGNLRLHTQVGLSATYAENHEHFPLDESTLEGIVAQENQALFSNDLLSHVNEEHPLITQETLGALALVPLAVPGGNGRSEPEVVGVLATAMGDIHHWQPRQIHLLTAVARQVGFAIQNHRLQRQLNAGLQLLSNNNNALAEIGQMLSTMQINGIH